MNEKILEAFSDCLRELGRSSRTIQGYTDALRRVFRVLRNPTISDVTPIDLFEWRRARSATTKPATVNLEMDALRQFFRWAVEEGLILADPSQRLKHVAQSGTLSPRWLSRQEQHQIIRAVQRAMQSANTERRQVLAVRDGALVALMLHAGLRVSEVCALDVADVELSERKGKVTVRHGKGGKRREVPLNRDAREAVSSWLMARDNEGPTLLPGERSKRLEGRSVRAAIERLGKTAGVHVTPHMLRHTFCHELVERGNISLDRVALLAGHTTSSGLPRIQTTVRYTMPSEVELEDAVETIEW